MTKREQAIVVNLQHREREEHGYLAFLQREQELAPHDVGLHNAVNAQINRWSTAYRALHETIDIIEA